MLLSVKNLSTEFPVKKGIVRAVEDVSFDVDQGEILAIVGESGSGKSVTSLSIMGLLAEPGHVAGGSLEFEGKDLATLSEKQYRELRGNDMAMIFQEPMTSLNPVCRVGNQPSTCCARWASPAPRHASTTTRTRCRAACASAL